MAEFSYWQTFFCQFILKGQRLIDGKVVFCFFVYKPVHKIQCFLLCSVWFSIPPSLAQWGLAGDWQCPLHLPDFSACHRQRQLRSDPRGNQRHRGEDVPNLGQVCGEFYFDLLPKNIPTTDPLSGETLYLIHLVLKR